MLVQLLERGSLVVAAARNPDKAPGLADLQKKYESALTPVKQDVADSASIKVLFSPPRLLALPT